MKVVVNNSNKISLADLSSGECFRWEGKTYMVLKCQDAASRKVPVVDLRHADLCNFDQTMRVHRVDAHVEVVC